MELNYTKLKATFLTLLMLLTVTTFAQSNFGQLRGKTKEVGTNNVVEYASIRLEQNGRFIDGVYSNYDGDYTFTTLVPGEYDVIATHVEYDTVRFRVTISPDSYIYRDIVMNKEGKSIVIGGGTVTGGRFGTTKIVEQDDHKVTMTEKDIKALPTRNLAAIADLTAGVNQTRGGGVSFRGSRTDGTAYFIDGVRVIGSVGQTQGAQGQITIYQSGIPAQFGDFTGGAISITTRNPSRNHLGSVEVFSSTPTEFLKLTGNRFDDDNRFLKENRFDNIQSEFYLSGPMYIKNKDKGAEERVILGYMLAGNYQFIRDPAPSYVGIFRVQDEKLREIEENPLVANRDGGLVHAGNFLTMDHIDNKRVRPNSRQYSGNLQYKMDYLPSKNSNISAYYSYQGSRERLATTSIMNFDLNPIDTRGTHRAYIRFTQKFGSSGKDTGLLAAKRKRSSFSGTYINLRADYQVTNFNRVDPVHGENYFDYGYIGKFERFTTPNFNYVGDLTNPDLPSRRFIDQNGDTVFLRNFWEQSGFRDTLYKFTKASEFIPGSRGENMNPLRANYTSNLYNFFGERGLNVTNETQILQNQGLVNGFNPPNVYSLWATPGFITSSYILEMSERFTAFGMIESTFKPSKNSQGHDLQAGFMFEQNWTRRYGLNAASLWILMPQLMNSHITELDRSNPFLTYDENGVFTDTVKYERFVNRAQQTNFDRNFRNKLINDNRKDVNGNPFNERSFIEINSMTPDDLDLKFFNANELLNNGASLVNYYGYDHLGKVKRGRPTVEDFTNDVENRALGAFQPTYIAGWIQDKFAYKDIIFRLGLRYEYYNANQLVLDDAYSLYPIRTKGEVSELNGLPVTHPGNMGDDYKVYVNDVSNPTRILGYRNGDEWYDQGGNEISNPQFISNQTNTGRIAPYLVDPTRQEISRRSFRDYKAASNFLPRIYFSFPLSPEANFFASFDVLAQRPPTGASFLTIDNYYFMDRRNIGVLANPDLIPRIKTEYQVGFKQMLGKNSGLELGAYYSEIKNDIQQFQVLEAYPVTYVTFRNIDFSTIKGFMAEYQLRDDHASLRANYNLQYADGTGSNPNSAAALIASNQPNLRTLFPLGELDIRHQVRVTFNYYFGGKTYDRTGRLTDDYVGPYFAKWLFENTNANVVLSANSGLPFTRDNVPTQIGSADRANILGTPFGNRLPWQYGVDFNVSKNVRFKNFLGSKKDATERKPIQANIFWWVTNAFNIERIAGAYQYTGLPNDDGFINSPRGQQAVSEQLSAQSYADLYRIIVTNPNNFLGPRFARLGVRFEF
jgi:hypothetical protein